MFNFEISVKTYIGFLGVQCLEFLIAFWVQIFLLMNMEDGE